MTGLLGSAIGEAYAHQTAVLGQLDGSPSPTCSECGDEVGVDMDIDQDGRAILLLCEDCAPDEPTPTCRQCKTEIEHPDLLWCSRSCRDEDYREQRAEQAGEL